MACCNIYIVNGVSLGIEVATWILIFITSFFTNGGALEKLSWSVGCSLFGLALLGLEFYGLIKRNEMKKSFIAMAAACIFRCIRIGIMILVPIYAIPYAICTKK